MNLIELAAAVYAEASASADIGAAEQAAEAEAQFLNYARGCVRRTLDEAAADLLDWQYIPADRLPDQIEEARALLTPGRLEYLRYRVDHSADASEDLDLIQPCRACDTDRISPVTSLFHLGQLLTQDEPQQDATDDQAVEPGPLAAIEALEDRAARLPQFARRLIAEHPGAGLTIESTSISSYGRGRATATLHLEADSVASARTVAAALGIEVTTSVSATPAPYDYVLEHASARGVVDGMDVELRAYTQLSDDEAAAWRAQQDQPADGGESE